jgi:hypothetical protein
MYVCMYLLFLIYVYIYTYMHRMFVTCDSRRGRVWCEGSTSASDA